MLLTLYLMVGFCVSYYVYEKLQNSGLSGDQLISMLPDNDYKSKLYDNPNMWRWVLTTAIIVIGLIWPITLYKIINDIDDIDKFRKI